jgi:endonuclease/exonuclease/phosphatase family metal-dependent hydrolase
MFLLVPVSYAASLKTMAFNIRFDNPSDGENAWRFRKQFHSSIYNSYGVDLFGIQEALSHQVRDIAATVVTHDYVTRGRERDGSGEACSVFYNRTKFARVSDETFWLSDTPTVPGSRSWGNTLPRICTRVELKPIGPLAGLENIMIFNTHWDHISANSRLNSAKLICDRAKAYLNTHLVIVMGDFNNSFNDSPEIKAITECGLMDSDRNPYEGTFHGFTGNSGSAKIDWVFVNSPLSSKVVGSAIIKDKDPRTGRFPSDHFAVMAEFAL